MRLSNFLVTFSACALFAACANDEMPGGNNLPQGNGEQAFIAVRLAAPNAMTRTFQDGKDEENAVTKARFYFFDNSGNAVTVGQTTGSTDINYYDVTSPSSFKSYRRQCRRNYHQCHCRTRKQDRMAYPNGRSAESALDTGQCKQEPD